MTSSQANRYHCDTKVLLPASESTATIAFAIRADLQEAFSWAIIKETDLGVVLVGLESPFPSAGAPLAPPDLLTLMVHKLTDTPGAWKKIESNAEDLLLAPNACDDASDGGEGAEEEDGQTLDLRSTSGIVIISCILTTLSLCVNALWRASPAQKAQRQFWLKAYKEQQERRTRGEQGGCSATGNSSTSHKQLAQTSTPAVVMVEEPKSMTSMVAEMQMAASALQEHAKELAAQNAKMLEQRQSWHSVQRRRRTRKAVSTVESAERLEMQDEWVANLTVQDEWVANQAKRPLPAASIEHPAGAADAAIA